MAERLKMKVSSLIIEYLEILMEEINEELENPLDRNEILLYCIGNFCKGQVNMMMGMHTLALPYQYVSKDFMTLLLKMIRDVKEKLAAQIAQDIEKARLKLDIVERSEEDLLELLEAIETGEIPEVKKRTAKRRGSFRAKQSLKVEFTTSDYREALQRIGDMSEEFNLPKIPIETLIEVAIFQEYECTHTRHPKVELLLPLKEFGLEQLNQLVEALDTCIMRKKVGVNMDIDLLEDERMKLKDSIKMLKKAETVAGN